MLRQWRQLAEKGIYFYRQAEDTEKQGWFTIGELCFEFCEPVVIEAEL